MKRLRPRRKGRWLLLPANRSTFGVHFLEQTKRGVFKIADCKLDELTIYGFDSGRYPIALTLTLIIEAFS